MKKIIIGILVVYASCLLFSMAKSDNEPARAVVGDSSSVIDTLKAKGATLIETTLYEFVDEFVMTQVVDSILKFDTYSSMSLTNVRVDKDSVLYIQQKFRLLNKDDLKHLRGVYYNDRVGKPLYIINLEDSDITNIGLTNTGRRVVVPCQTARPNTVQVVNLGYSAFYRRRDENHYGISLYYNNMPISKESDASDRFKWFNPSWSKDSIIKEKIGNSRRLRYKSHYEVNVNGIGQKTKINEKCDTVYFYGISLKDSPFNTAYTLPLYEFDDSHNGRIIKRICDSILGCNASVKLGIMPSKMNDAPAIYIADILNPTKVTGLIIDHTNRFPIILDCISQESLKEYGINKSNRNITVVHTDSRNSLWVDPNTYQSWIQITPEGGLKIAVLFANEPLYKDLAEPFMWLIEE